MELPEFKKMFSSLEGIMGVAFSSRSGQPFSNVDFNKIVEEIYATDMAPDFLGAKDIQSLWVILEA